MTTKETWRRIPELPEYLASSHGRLMRIPHVGCMPHGGPKHYGGYPQRGTWDGKRWVWAYRGKNYRVATLIYAAPFMDRARSLARSASTATKMHAITGRTI